MDIVTLVLAVGCSVLTLFVLFGAGLVVIYATVSLFLNSQVGQRRVVAQPQQMMLPPVPPQPVSGWSPESRDPTTQAVLIVDEGTVTDFYAVIKFIPFGATATQAVRPEFMQALRGDVNARIVTEQTAMQMGKRYGGFAYVTELSIPKVV